MEIKQMPKFVPWVMGIIGAVLATVAIGSIPWASSVQSNIASMRTTLAQVLETSKSAAALAQLARDEQLKRSQDSENIKRLETTLLFVQNELVKLNIEVEKMKTLHLEFERRLIDMERGLRK